MVPPVHSVSFVHPETQLGVPRRSGIANAINSHPLPRALRGVLLLVASNLGLAGIVSLLIAG